jgi:hypothetical protein
VLLWLAVAALVLAPAVFWRGGVLEEETIVFLGNYLDGRTVLEKVFDPHGNDFDTYQARELSYFFDFLDAQWLRAILRAGLVLFSPPSAILASILTAVVFLGGAARAFPRLPGSTRALVLLVLLSNYVFLTTMGLCYRATKPMMVPVLLALLSFVWVRLRPGAAAATASRDFAVVFGLACLTSAFDRQGFFYVVVLTGALGLTWAVRRGTLALALGAAAASLASVAYNYRIGPWLIETVNGYRPRFNYQRIPVAKLLDPSYYEKVAELLPGYAATLFGGFPTWIFAMIATGAAVGWLRVRGLPPPEVAPRSARWLGPSLLALFLLSQVFMFAAMLTRYPQVYDWADHRIWYYPWPLQAILAFGVLVALDAVWARLRLGGRRVVEAGLVVLAVANVVQWPRHREVSLHSDWFPKIHDQTRRLETSLRSGAADSGLYGAYREFLHFARDLSPALQSRIAVDVREGPGLYRTELRDERVFAWARKGAVLYLVVGEAGDYELLGELWLRPQETVTLTRPGAIVARVLHSGEVEGPAPLTLSLTLPPGRTELSFESDRDERDVGGVRDRKAVAFGLFLPVLRK